MPRRAAALLSLALLLAGCQGAVRAYDGPARPDSEVAILRANPPTAYVAFRVTAVDDRAMDVQLDPIALLPGPHTLHLAVTPTTVLQWSNIRGQQASVTREYDAAHRQDMTLTFTAAAGGRYALNGRMNTQAGTTEIWVYDTSTEQRLASATAP